MHRGAFFQFLFRWIHYCHSSKSTGKETGKTHLCAMHSTETFFYLFCPWKYGKTTLKSRLLKQNCRKFQYCPDGPICPKKKKNARFIWVFIVLGIYKFGYRMGEIDWQENEVAKINAMNKFRVKKPPHAISAAQAVTWLIEIV